MLYNVLLNKISWKKFYEFYILYDGVYYFFISPELHIANEKRFYYKLNEKPE